MGEEGQGRRSDELHSVAALAGCVGEMDRTGLDDSIPTSRFSCMPVETARLAVVSPTNNACSVVALALCSLHRFHQTTVPHSACGDHLTFHPWCVISPTFTFGVP